MVQRRHATQPRLQERLSGDLTGQCEVVLQFFFAFVWWSRYERDRHPRRRHDCAAFRGALEHVEEDALQRVPEPRLSHTLPSSLLPATFTATTPGCYVPSHKAPRRPRTAARGASVKTVEARLPASTIGYGASASTVSTVEAHLPASTGGRGASASTAEARTSASASGGASVKTVQARLSASTSGYRASVKIVRARLPVSTIGGRASAPTAEAVLSVGVASASTAEALLSA